MQPDAVTAIMGDDVRWVGNEGGVGRETEWSTTAFTPLSYLRSGQQNGSLSLVEMSKDLGSRELIGKAQEVFWYPSEVDVSIRPGWFYHPYQDKEVKSLEHLVDIYYKSVGRNSVLLLNIPPDTRGLIHEIDAQRLLELRKYLDETFSTDLACGSRKLWKASEGSSMILDVTPESTFNTFMIREDISKGQRVEGFTLEAWKDGQWEKIAEGTTVGYRRLLRFPDLQTSKVRVTITATRLSALISEMGLYHAPEVSSYLGVKKIGDMDPSSWKAVTEGAEAACDGDLTTEWKTEGLTPLVIDMGNTAVISGFVYAPADDEDLEGTIFRYDFAVSKDGHNWETVISDGEFSNIMHNPVPFTVKLRSEVNARYIRLTPREEISGRKCTSVAEMGVVM